MRKIVKTLKRLFCKKADVIVYQNGKAYKFKTLSEAYAFVNK